eukprot:12656007-Prorocentrum_lima.AAC.1
MYGRICCASLGLALEPRARAWCAVPTTSERAAASGVQEHCSAMHLPEQALYDVQGDMFDRALLG